MTKPINKVKREFCWHYGLVIHDECLWLHEIFDDNGRLSWTENPIEISGENVKDVLWALRMAVKDIKKGYIYETKKHKLIKIENDRKK